MPRFGAIELAHYSVEPKQDNKNEKKSGENQSPKITIYKAEPKDLPFLKRLYEQKEDYMRRWEQFVATRIQENKPYTPLAAVKDILEGTLRRGAKKFEKLSDNTAEWIKVLTRSQQVLFAMVDGKPAGMIVDYRPLKDYDKKTLHGFELLAKNRIHWLSLFPDETGNTVSGVGKALVRESVRDIFKQEKQHPTHHDSIDLIAVTNKHAEAYRTVGFEPYDMSFEEQSITTLSPYEELTDEERKSILNVPMEISRARAAKYVSGMSRVEGSGQSVDLAL